MSCVFCDIVAKKIPADIVYEDDKVIVFHDANPKAPVHLLLVPKQHIATLREAETVDYLFQVANQVMKQDYRVQINVGRGAGMEIEHLHIHLFQFDKPQNICRSSPFSYRN